MSSLSAQDLRSHAKDHGRVKAHNAKWSRGSRPAAGRQCAHNLAWDGYKCDECLKRPFSLKSRNYTSMMQTQSKKDMTKDNTSTKRVLRGVVVEAVGDVHDDLSDSSGDFDVDDASAAPELNEVMYSYDAPTGPSRGNDILSFALTKAVQRFENNETEKIVKNEYDLVLDGKDESEQPAADVDDDFELIDSSHL